MQKDVKHFTTKVGDSLQIDRQFQLNHFTRKEERSVYKNRFLRSYKVIKEDLSVKKTRL